MLIISFVPFLLFYSWKKAEEFEELGFIITLKSIGLTALNFGIDLHPSKISTRILVISLVMTTFLLMKHWEAILISFLAKQTVSLPFNNLQEFYENTKSRLLIVPGGMIENDFRHSTDPLWQKIFRDRIGPHLAEVKAYPDSSTDLFHFIENDYNTAIYDLYEAYT